MRRTTRVITGVVGLAILLTGCGSQEQAADPKTSATASPSASTAPTPTAPALADATAVARELKKNVATVSKVTTLTEDNDSNNLIGRPNGYVSAAVITDKDGDTSDKDPGVAYGATVEMFDSAPAATSRSKYIQGILKDTPMLGTEYDYVAGQVLLRVSGDIKPSVAKTYQAAFQSLNLS